MIRPVTCICFALAVGSGLYLYQAKDAAQVLDRTIEKAVRETEATRDQTRALRTEWTLRNEPDRLRQLAERYLPSLQPIAPAQFTNLSDLDARLPSPQVNQPSDQAPLPEDGGASSTDGIVGAEVVIPQSGSPDDLPLPPVPPVPVRQAGAVLTTPPLPSGPVAPTRPQAQLTAVSAAQPPAAERSAAPAKAAVSVALVQPQGPRVLVPEPHPIASRPAEIRPDNRAASAPTELRVAEPVRGTEAARPSEARTAAAPKPVSPVRSLASAAPAPGPTAPIRAASSGGSMLGMARETAGGSAPIPVPLPRPVPVNGMSSQFPSGG